MARSTAPFLLDRVRVGSSSRLIRLEAPFTLATTRTVER